MLGAISTILFIFIGGLTAYWPKLGIGLTVGLPVMIIGLSFPSWIIGVLYPSIWFLGQIPLRAGSSDFSLERGIVLFAGFGLLASILKRREIVLFPSNTLLVSSVLMIGAMFFSTFINQAEYGLFQLISLIQKIVFAWLVFVSLNHINRVRKAMRLFLIASVFASFFTIIVIVQSGNLFIIQSSSFVAGDSVSENLLRGIARAGAGNTIAVWLALLEARTAKTQERKLLWLLVLVWTVIFALLALRREVLIIIPVGFLVLTWRSRTARNRTVLAGLITISLLAVFISISPEWSYRLNKNPLAGTANETRWILLQYSWEAFKAAPVLGHGPGTFRDVQFQFPEYVQRLGLTIYQNLKFGVASHNSFSTFLVETGIVGSLGFCLMLVWMWKQLTSRVSLQNKFIEDIWPFSLVIFVNILLKFSFGDGILINVHWFWVGVLWSVIALAINDRSLRNSVWTASTVRTENAPSLYN